MLASSAVSACIQDRKAPVEYKQGTFYGRDGYYDGQGNELPKYNNYNRAQLPEHQASKYVNDKEHQYGVSASVAEVEAQELPPPEPVQSTELAPIAQSSPALNSQVATQSQPTINRTAADPFDADSIPIVKEGTQPVNEKLLPDFDKQQSDAQAKLEQSKINWQKTKDNAESSYDAKMLQAEAEQAQLQQQAQAEIVQQKQAVQPKQHAAIDPNLLPKELAKSTAEPKVIAPEAITAPKPQPKYKVHDALKGEKFVWPLKGNILKDYKNDASKGLVIAGRTGEPVRASASGSVVFVGEKIKSLGKMIIIQHPDGYVTTYSHLNDMVVSENDNVVAGQLIGFVGKTGNAQQPQLHFAVRHNTKPVDPMSALSK